MTLTLFAFESMFSSLFIALTVTVTLTLFSFEFGSESLFDHLDCDFDYALV